MFEILRCLAFALASGNPKDGAAEISPQQCCFMCSTAAWISCVAH